MGCAGSKGDADSAPSPGERQDGANGAHAPADHPRAEPRHAAVPSCHACHKTASLEWGEMPSTQRRYWVWMPEQGNFLCRGCHREQQESKKAKQEERDKLRLAKVMKFGDKVSKAPGLRRIDSLRAWEATPSFEAPLQLSEAVEIRMLVLEMTRANKQQSAAAAAAAEAATLAAAEPSREDASWTEAPNTPLPVIEKSTEQRAALAAATSRVLLFRQLAPAQYAAVLDAMFERVVRAGETVIRQGDEPDNFYVVDTGAFEVFVSKPPTAPPKLVMTYSQGGTFGELALLNRARRAATVVAKTDGVLWALGRAAFTRVLVDATQKQRDQYSAFLQGVPMLHGLDPYDLAAMADNLVAVSFAPGETVIRQGDAGDAFFLVLEGTGAATVRDDDAPDGVKEVMQYAPGSHFGELALLRDEPRAASVVATTAMKCARMDVDAFKRILARPLKASMDRQLALYSRATDEKFVR